MTDYRRPENRRAYFDALYAMNLRHGVMPGLVYTYLPELTRRLGWDAETQLWAAFLNGLTQNPITTLVFLEHLPRCPLPTDSRLGRFQSWFNDNWDRLQFDVDRQKNKRGTVAAIQSYAALAQQAGSQAALYAGKTYAEAWAVASQIHTFGRLSTFSYLEYVHLLGHGPDCDDLMFGDLEGSRSHRNGMLMLMGHDHLVMDKRAGTGVRGYKDLKGMAEAMSVLAGDYLVQFRRQYPELSHAGNFTLESNFCSYKNSFFGRRYPGVYADMAWDRILWAEERGWEAPARVFRQIRQDCLPDWLRIEDRPDGLTLKQRGAVFPETGVPYRAEHFL